MQDTMEASHCPWIGTPMTRRRNPGDSPLHPSLTRAAQGGTALAICSGAWLSWELGRFLEWVLTPFSFPGIKSVLPQASSPQPLQKQMGWTKVIMDTLVCLSHQSSLTPCRPPSPPTPISGSPARMRNPSGQKPRASLGMVAMRDSAQTPRGTLHSAKLVFKPKLRGLHP